MDPAAAVLNGTHSAAGQLRSLCPHTVCHCRLSVHFKLRHSQHKGKRQVQRVAVVEQHSCKGRVGNDNEQQATMSETTYQKMEHVSTPKLQTCPVMVPKLIYVLTLIVPQHGTSSTPVRIAAGHRPALPFPPLPEELLSPHPPSSLCYHVTQGDIL